MKAAAIDGAANLAHQQTPPFGAELGRYLLQRYHPMGQTLDVGARFGSSPVIQE